VENCRITPLWLGKVLRRGDHLNEKDGFAQNGSDLAAICPNGLVSS
jgi:hypothetical protein